MKNILISWRNIKNNKVNSLINIVGLGIALGVFAVAMVIVNNEYSYNRCFKDYERIYRLTTYDSAGQYTNVRVPFVLSQTLVEYSQIEETCALTGNHDKLTVEKTGQEIPVSGTTGSFFEMFGIKVIEGDVYDLEKISKSIILTQSQAKEIFGDEHCTGKILSVKWSVQVPEWDEMGNINIINEERSADLTVVAVVADYPKKATFQPTAYLPMEFFIEHNYFKGCLTMKQRMEEMDFSNPSSSVYVKFSKHARVNEVESAINENLRRIHKIEKKHIDFQAITYIYFDDSRDSSDQKHGGNLLLCKSTFIIGLLILLIAFFNYVNLSSVTADRRLRTQAICQINGAKTGNIVSQSVVESLMLIALSLPLSVLVALYGLPKFCTVFNIGTKLSFFGNFAGLAVIWAGTAIVFGVFSGFAIKFRLRRISLADAVKSSVIKTGDRLIFTNILTIIQIAIFCGLLASILIMDKQIKYELRADLGFDKDGLVLVEMQDKQYTTFKDEARKVPGIIGLSGTDIVPMNTDNCWFRGYQDDTLSYWFGIIKVDFDFFRVVGNSFVEGEDFEKGKPAVIINQNAHLSSPWWKIGEITWGVSKSPLQGIVTDFNFGNAHSQIPPYVFMYEANNDSQFGNVLLRVNLLQTPNIISDIEKVWKKIFPDTDFKWSFAEDKIAESYRKEMNFSHLISALTIIALFIAIIGIIGLSTALNQKRVKEIGIRKVNGATSAEILQMLCRRYIWMVAVAIAISVPCAYSFVTYWLKDFAYKIGITPEPFIISAIATLLIVLATVAIQSLSVARRNPVEAIKTE